MTGDAPPTAWLGLYGEFAVPVTATEEAEKALIVTGQMEFSGGDLTDWSALRYGFYNNQNAGALADSAGVWTGKEQPAGG